MRAHIAHKTKPAEAGFLLIYYCFYSDIIRLLQHR